MNRSGSNNALIKEIIPGGGRGVLPIIKGLAGDVPLDGVTFSQLC